ncbi:28822_t:CDS:2, partial [Racocetra persica]
KDYLTQIIFPDVYHKSHDDKQWFEDYDENKFFIYDDFYNYNIEYSTLLILINNKPHMVQKKGSYENFINLRFDIEFNSNITLEEIGYITKHNSIKEQNGIWYYNHNFNLQVDKFELTDYRIENKLHVNTIVYPEIKRKLENRLCRTKRKRIQFKGYKEGKIDYVIEDLDNDEKYYLDASTSSLSSNDSEMTKRRKKGKTVCTEN